jgi:hypothetical protein
MLPGALPFGPRFKTRVRGLKRLILSLWAFEKLKLQNPAPCRGSAIIIPSPAQRRDQAGNIVAETKQARRFNIPNANEREVNYSAPRANVPNLASVDPLAGGTFRHGGAPTDAPFHAR